MDRMKNIQRNALAVFVWTTCAAVIFGFTPAGFSITGSIQAGNGTVLRLAYDYNGKRVIDSVPIKDNSFSMRGAFPEPVVCTLSNSANQQIRIFVAENTQILVKGNIGKFFSLNVEAGNEDFLYNDNKSKSMELAGAFREMLSETGQSPRDRSTLAYQLYHHRLDSLNTDFVTSHKGNTAAALAIIDSYVNNPNREKADDLYRELSATVQNTIYGKRILLFTLAAEAIKPGNAAPDFTLKDLDGNTVKLSNYKGKYILLDFWASWCSPCRQEHPFLKTIRKKFISDNLEFISISLDVSGSSWKQAVTTDGLTWLQLNDPKAMNGEVSDRYGVKSLPFNCIIDPKGIIIATSLRGGALESFLDKQFDKTK